MTWRTAKKLRYLLHGVTPHVTNSVLSRISHSFHKHSLRKMGTHQTQAMQHPTLAKQICTDLLGHHLPDFQLELDGIKNRLMHQRDKLKMTSEDFDKIENMFAKAVHPLIFREGEAIGAVKNNEMMRQWDTVSRCFRLDIEKGVPGKITDKRVVSWDVLLKDVLFEPHFD